MLHQIGIGALGPVFRTYEPSRDRLVAVKAFRLDIVPEQAQALALALSRAAHASLFHPSIVEPIDAGVEGTLAYRAEEYVAAESLDVAMRHYAPAPAEKVLPFITQLAGAIDFARAAGIGHGGLHPRDIFVTPDEARATGFGVVEALEQVGIRAPVRRPYSAPERIAGSAWGTPADVFSLAAITFELLTGKRPSGTGAQIGALTDTANAAALHPILARAMDDDPAKRHASALAFAAALEAASQGRSISDTVLQPPPVQPAAVAPAVAPVSPAPPAGRDSEATIPQSWAHEEEAEDASVVEPTIVGAAGTLAAAGEFEIEERLDPLHAALAQDEGETNPDEREADVLHAPTLFDDAPVGGRGGEQFASEFVAEQKAEPEFRSPLEDAPPPVQRASPEPALFRALDPDPHDMGERSRLPILPYALTLVLGLLLGFAAGRFMGNRDRVPAEEASKAPATATTAPASAATSGAATPDKPGQYSEQKVTPPVSRPTAEPTAPAASAGKGAVASPPPASRRATPPPVSRETAAPQRGQIVVRSTPSRAGVTVNGTWRGRTPLTLENLPFGSYAVRVVQPGYAPSREEITLSARAPSRTFSARLERTATAAPPAPSPSTPATFTGSIFVDSRPRGATVTVDGRNVGQTPLSVPDVKAGSHVVRIEMNGKKPVMANPRVIAGQTERITVSLEDKEDLSAGAPAGGTPPQRAVHASEGKR